MAMLFAASAIADGSADTAPADASAAASVMRPTVRLVSDDLMSRVSSCKVDAARCKTTCLFVRVRASSGRHSGPVARQWVAMRPVLHHLKHFRAVVQLPQPPPAVSLIGGAAGRRGIMAVDLSGIA